MVKYVGESGRSSAERSQEHHYDTTCTPSTTRQSHMRAHLEEQHRECLEEDMRNIFTMKVVRQHTRPLNRELHEAKRITREGAKGAELLNSKEGIYSLLHPQPGCGGKEWTDHQAEGGEDEDPGG